MRITTGTLADGREITWYDSSDQAPPRTAVDTRELPATATSSELRWNPLLGEWVVIADHRQTRTFLPPTAECPLCASRDGRATEIPTADYEVVVFENRFPSFSTHATLPERLIELEPSLYRRELGRGRCEVVVFSDDHHASFASLTRERARLVIEAWVDRTGKLSRLPFVEQVFCFENRGEEIGVTLSHPHGQIYAYPMVTPRTRLKLANARVHMEATGRNLFADVLAAERAAGDRVVAANDRWTAFVPAAARWPFEVHLYPHRQVPDLPATDPAEREAFVEIYLDVLRRLDGVFGLRMPYIAAWEQAPLRHDRELAYLHLELFSIRRAPGKLKYLAGSESAMGVFINDIAPERAAEMLRKVRL